MAVLAPIVTKNMSLVRKFIDKLCDVKLIPERKSARNAHFVLFIHVSQSQFAKLTCLINKGDKQCFLF